MATAYTQSLLTDAALTADWRYALVLPEAAILASGGAYRIRFSGPASGATLFQHIYAARKGSGAYDFVGSPQAITVGGLTSFTVNPGQQVWSDPVEGVITAGAPVVICYDAVGGSGRAYRGASASGHTLHYLSGLGGVSNANVIKSGYASVASFTAVVTGIEVQPTLSDFEDPESPLPDEDEEPVCISMQEWGIHAVNSDQIYARGEFIDGIAGEYLHVNLCSQANSGKNVYLWGIEVDPSADTRFSIRALLPVAGWESIAAICNADFREGAPYATARLYKGYSTSVLGGKHSVGTLRSGHTKLIHMPPYPLVKASPGFTGACLALHTLGVGAAITFHWQEVPL